MHLTFYTSKVNNLTADGVDTPTILHVSRVRMKYVFLISQFVQQLTG